jgi:large subunit ribosomal protein L4
MTDRIEVDLPAEIFDVQVNIPLIHQVVVAQQAAARQGTHATKTRGDVRGGGRKPYRQKGTGRARQGSTRAPQFAGGGTVHGPHPRSYDQRTPKKMKVAALRGALSDRARAGRVHVVDGLVGGDRPSTKAAVEALVGVTDTRRALVVLERGDDLTWLSLRNVAEVHLLAVDQLNTYDVLVADDVVFTKGAYDAFVSGPVSGKSAKAVASSSEDASLIHIEDTRGIQSVGVGQAAAAADADETAEAESAEPDHTAEPEEAAGTGAEEDQK